MNKWKILHWRIKLKKYSATRAGDMRWIALASPQQDNKMQAAAANSELQKTGGGGNRAAWRIQIRSGPEGARGVLASEVLFPTIMSPLGSFPPWKFYFVFM